MPPHTADDGDTETMIVESRDPEGLKPQPFR